MKKIFAVLVLGIALLLGLASCTREFESFTNNYTYTNPRKVGGKYTVIQNGFELQHLECVYWATEDDDAVFKASNGKLVFVNGSSIIIQE